jgi:hypothetical protein
MKWLSSWVVLVVCTGLLGVGSGCGGGQVTLRSDDDLANAKLNAIKRLADVMAKEPDGAEARGELENFRNTSFDVKKHPKQAEEIADIYRQRIQNKYKGFVAQELRGEMGSILAQLKQSK